MTRRLVYDIETTGLEPWKDKIICIGVADLKSDEINLFQNEDEEKLVKEFIKYVKAKEFDKVIGYNVSFDNRFIMAKCLDYKINCGFFFDQPYHIDLMNKVQNPVDMYSRNSSGSLDDWVRYLFSDGKSEDNGDIPEMYEKGQLDKIKDYCKKDVRITAKLWRRLNRVGVL